MNNQVKNLELVNQICNNSNYEISCRGLNLKTIATEILNLNGIKFDKIVEIPLSWDNQVGIIYTFENIEYTLYVGLSCEDGSYFFEVEKEESNELENTELNETTLREKLLNDFDNDLNFDENMQLIDIAGIVMDAFCETGWLWSYGYTVFEALKMGIFETLDDAIADLNEYKSYDK